ncbi:hypothetical protein D3C78_1961770 [compost metagenome]
MDFVIALVNPLDHVFVPQHTHTPEQIDEPLRPRRTLRQIRWHQQVLLEQGEQLPIQHTRKILLPLLL